MRFPEIYKVVPVIASDDINAGVDADSINMKNFFRATFILLFGTLSGDAVLTVNSGATDGAKTSALTFHYALGGAALGAADCDVLAADATSAALTLTAATYTDKMLIVEVEAVDMDVENGENWLTLSLSNAANSGTVDGVCILEAASSKNRSVSALA
jgi:hypothetical protein